MMRPHFALLLLRVWSIKNRILTLRRDDMVKTGVVIAGMTMIALLAWVVAFQSFHFVEAVPAIGPPLNERLLALFFLVLLVMVIFSTAIITYATLFVASETGYLFQSPLPPSLIFHSRVAESVFLSAWATLFLGLPVLTAFGQVRGAPLGFYPAAGLSLLFFLLFAGCAGAALTLLLLEIVRRWTWKRLLAAIAILAGAPAWVFLRSFDFGALDGAQNLQVLDRFARGLPLLSSPFFPGRWMASLVISGAGRLSGEALFQGGLLAANTLIWIPIFSLYGKSRFPGQWLRSREASSWRGNGGRGAARRERELSAGALSGPLASLLRKDLRTFVRDPGQVTQFVLFCLLLSVYLASLLQIPRNLFGERWGLFLYHANLGAISLVLASFASRFLFPLLSLEGRSFWIVGLAPIDRTFLLRQKSFLGALLILPLGVAAALASTHFLGFDWERKATAAYTILLAGMSLVSLSTGLGAAYPSLREDNPARIATGLGGTLNFFSSAALVVLILTIEGLPAILSQRSWEVTLAAHGTALLVASIVSGYALRLGRRSLATMDF